MERKRIAVIGASNDRKKFGNKAVRAYLAQGHEVLPVNPKEETIEGLKAYKSVADIPGRIDIANIYLPPKRGIEVIEEVARKGIKDVFLNPGTESPELVEKGERLGLHLMLACSIRAIGTDPGTLPEE